MREIVIKGDFFKKFKYEIKIDPTKTYPLPELCKECPRYNGAIIYETPCPLHEK